MLIYICDDVEQDRKRLEHSLKRYSQTLSAGFAISDLQIESYEDADDMIRAFAKSRQKPAVIFLDIYMKGRDGMETAAYLRKMGCNAGLIFVTTSQEHAIESYDVDALYYLKKPYTWERFTAAMDKCRQIFLENAACFTGTVNRKEYTIPYNKITCFETSGHTVIVHQIDAEPVAFYMSMSNVAESVKDYPGFLAVGKSYIVNMNDVESYSDGMLEMKDGMSVPVPVRCMKTVESALDEYRKKQ